MYASVCMCMRAHKCTSVHVCAHVLHAHMHMHACVYFIIFFFHFCIYILVCVLMNGLHVVRKA